MKLIQGIGSRSALSLDLIANFAGAGWSAVLGLVCIPLYIRFMGIEAYGLVGFYFMLQAMLLVLDLGLSPTINREMARYSVQPEKSAECRDLVRTLETGYWLIGLAIGCFIFSAAPWVAAHWVKAANIPTRTVSEAVMIMGVWAVVQWPIKFYQSGLLGLRRQVLYNLLRIGGATFHNGGAVLILWLVSPTIKAFLLWQVLASTTQVTLLMLFLWLNLPPSERAPRFNPTLARNIWQFAAGMSGIAVLGLILSQVDKVIVSKLFSLRVFGYYTLAWAVANGLLAVSRVVFNAVFPRMSEQVAAHDENGIRDSYHRGSQLMAVLIFPAAAVLALFPFSVLRLWTQNGILASHSGALLSVLVVGSALNAVFYMPFGLQLAFGWTSLSLFTGLLWVAILVPAMFPMAKHFGAVGVASVWAILNILNVVVVAPLMHRRLLPGEVWGYFRDIGLPLASTIILAALGRLVFGSPATSARGLIVLSSVWLACVIAAASTAPRIRSWAFARVRNVGAQYVP